MPPHSQSSSLVAVERIAAVAANQRVVAVVAQEDVVPVAAVQVVRELVAGEDIVVLRSDQVLDVREHVAFRRAALPGPGRQIDGDAGVGVAVVRGVVAGFAVEDVVAGAAEQDVVTLAAVEDVVAVAAQELVVAPIAIEVVVAVLAIEDVEVGAAGKDVVAGAAKDDIVAPLAASDIVSAIAVDLVVLPDSWWQPIVTRLAGISRCRRRLRFHRSRCPLSYLLSGVLAGTHCPDAAAHSAPLTGGLREFSC